MTDHKEDKEYNKEYNCITWIPNNNDRFNNTDKCETVILHCATPSPKMNFNYMNYIVSVELCWYKTYHTELRMHIPYKVYDFTWISWSACFTMKLDPSERCHVTYVSGRASGLHQDMSLHNDRFHSHTFRSCYNWIHSKESDFHLQSLVVTSGLLQFDLLDLRRLQRPSIDALSP